MERQEEAPILADSVARLSQAGSVLLVTATSEEAEQYTRILAEKGVNATMYKEKQGTGVAAKGLVLIQSRSCVAEAASTEFLKLASRFSRLAFTPSVERSREKVDEALTDALVAMFGRVGANMVRGRGEDSGGETAGCASADTLGLAALLGCGADQVRIRYHRNIHAWLRGGRQTG